MDLTILFHIIELCLFLIALCLSALVKCHRPRSAFIKRLIVIEIALTVLGGILLGVYDIVIFLMK